MNKALSVAMVLFALVLAVAPIFTDCESHGKLLATADGHNVSMKCHWAGIAEIAAAVPLGVAGIAGLRARRRETARLAGIVGASSAAMALLIPTVLIGTCANPMMACNLLMKPTLLAAGILALLASLALIVLAREPEASFAGAAA